LKQLRELSLEIHIATMSLGDCGSANLGREAISSKRKEEAEHACALLGSTYHYVGSSDFCIFNDDDHNRKVTALFREVAPDIVFTHSPADYLLDHETTSILGRNACFYAPVLNYDTPQYNGTAPIHRVPYLFYFDAMEGVDIFGKRIVPEFYVDVSRQIDFKREMLERHASQREWLASHHGMDSYIASMRAWAAVRGAEAASAAGQTVQHAEAFRQHRGHAYPHDNVLVQLLREQVINNPWY